MIYIDTKKLHSIQFLFQNLPIYLLHQNLKRCKKYKKLKNDIYFQQLESSIIKLKNMQQQCVLYCLHNKKIYEQTEYKIRKQAEKMKHDSAWKKSKINVYHHFHTSIRKDKSIISYLKNGACVGIFAGIDVLKFQKKYNSKYVNGKINTVLGNAQISGDAKATLFDDKKFRPGLMLTGEASASLIKNQTNVSLGNSHIRADGELDVQVGCAKAEGMAVINKEEITIKGDVGMVAVKGEAKGSITLFGVTISATGTAELGSIGASAEFSSKKGEFSFGAKGSLIAGLGFRIKVNY